MLRPIPSRILKHTVTLQTCTGVDMWQAPTWEQTTLTRVCMQPSNETKKSKDNTEVVLRGVCFVEAGHDQKQISADDHKRDRADCDEQNIKPIHSTSPLLPQSYHGDT